MILANTVFVGVDVDLDRDGGDDDPSSIYFQMDAIFAVFFTLEIFIRILAYRSFKMYLTDPPCRMWNIIDLIFVIVVDLESFVFPFVIPPDIEHYIRPLRLIRLVRIFRVYVDIPILAIMMRSIIASLHAVVYLLAFQTVITYIVALLLVNWSRSTPQVTDAEEESDPHFFFHQFGHVYLAGLSLFQLFTVDACFLLINDVIHTTAYMGFLMLVYFAFSTMLIYNILIGGVCRAVSTNAVLERDNRSESLIRKILKRGDPLMTGYVSVPTYATKVLPKFLRAKELNENRIEIAKSLAIRSTDERVVVDSDAFVIAYLKLSKPVQTQDLVVCLTEVDSLYQLIENSIPHE
jgi:hypothetical protein